MTTDELLAENKNLRDKISELNRRCQRAESAALVKVEEVRKSGPSLGRALAGWAAQKYKDALVEYGRHKEGCLSNPCICGFTEILK